MHEDDWIQGRESRVPGEWQPYKVSAEKPSYRSGTGIYHHGGRGGTYAVDGEVQAPELVVLILRDLEQAGGLVRDGSSGVLVRIEGIGREEGERGAGVEDGGVAGAPLALPVQRPRGRRHLPEALRATRSSQDSPSHDAI